MLPKKLKLSVEEFPKRGTFCFKGKTLSLKKAPNELDYSRLGVLVGKRVNPKATVRNWVKRIINDVSVRKMSELPRGLDLLVVVGGHIIGTSLETKELLRRETEEALDTLRK